MADGAGIATKARDKSQNNPGGDCPYCSRPGLPILPLRFAYHPNVAGAEAADKSAKVKQDNLGWKGGDCVVRVMQDGYVYMFDERNGTWRYFAVTADGYFREYPIEQVPPGQVTFSCSRQGDHVKASVINVLEPKKAGTVWLAYSSVLWTKKVRDKYKGDAALRGLRMMPLVLGDVLAHKKPENGFFIDPSGTNMGIFAAEYAGLHAVYDKSLTSGLNRQAHAADLGKYVNDVMPGKGLAFCLSDDVGIAQEMRHYANGVNTLLNQVERKYAREITVSRAFERLEKSYKDGGKGEEWTEKYADCIDTAKLSQFRSKYEAESRNLIGTRDKHCDDYLAHVQSARFKAIRDEDFDRTNAPASVQFVDQFSAILFGVGLNDNERAFAEKSLSNIDNDNVWFRVLAGNQEALLQFAFEHKTKDVYGNFKKLYSAVDKWEKMYQDVAKELGIAADEVTAANAATTKAAGADRFFRSTLKIKESIKNVMFGMQGLGAKLSQSQFMRAGAMAGWIWFKTVPIPLLQELTGAQSARYMKEALWTMEMERRLIQTINGGGAKNWTMNVADIADELGDGANVKVRFIVFDWDFHLEQTSKGGVKITATETFEQGVAELRVRKVVADVAMTAVEDKFAGLPRVASGTNFWKSAIKTVRAGPASAGLAAFAGYFQVVAFFDAAELSGAKSHIKMIAAGIGLMGAFSEFAGGSLKIWKEIYNSAGAGKLGAWGIKNATAFSAYGGMLSGLASVIGGCVTVYDGVSLRGEGDMDAGNWTIAAGGFLIIGGVASIAGGYASLAGAAPLLGFGPAGWAVLAILAVGVGIYCLFQAEEDKDDPLQTWMKKSCLGKSPKTYASKGEEDKQFGELFKLPIEVKMEWRKGLAGGNFTVEIIAPAMDKAWLAYDLTVQMEDGKVLKASENRSIKGGGLQYVNIPQFRPYESQSNALYSAPANGVRWHLMYSTFQNEPVKASVLLKYWPNKTENPDIVLPEAGGKKFEILASDAT
ncbi:T6SS effector BTH_I2691 family protein [Lysobacter capsici]|uniref:T6SS effector BTH_I2691 family protein n=1 Tax=Lysobacter capsici TaxID=435897 RepID=UPI001C003356|nr:T6SS effector BTH_I2691 family protein [Lysobacter capsici]QWF19581.1 hypothetical protein KME82_12960 [Lysobacter capsici]